MTAHLFYGLDDCSATTLLQKSACLIVAHCLQHHALCCGHRELVGLCGLLCRWGSAGTAARVRMLMAAYSLGGAPANCGAGRYEMVASRLWQLHRLPGVYLQRYLRARRPRIAA